MVREPLEITLLRGRTEPEEDGRTDAVAVLLEEAVCVPEGDFAPEDDLPVVDGLAPVDGLVPVDGDVVFGAAGFSVAGGTFACATGSPPPPERL